MEAVPENKKIAVIGSGISGIVSAYLLDKRHRVTLFEKNERLGGHTNTRTVTEANGKTLSIDTGFIVCNKRNYPLFYRFLDKLGVKLRDSDMSFGFYCEESRCGYTGPTLQEFLRNPSNLLSLRWLKMLCHRRRFNEQARRHLFEQKLVEIPLGEYAKTLNLPDTFLRDYLLPISGAVWSSPDSEMLKFPTRTFLTFLENHGMLHLPSIPQWQTVVQGSQAYIDAFQRQFSGEIRLQNAVREITRENGFCSVITADGEVETFDIVVIACHADEALRLLRSPSVAEQNLLSSWSYHKNTIMLHSDQSLLPPKRSYWASWNYLRKRNDNGKNPVAISYHMNRLQGLESHEDYFVTLNATTPVDEGKIHYQTTYTHPAFTPESIAAQKEIQVRNGTDNTFFCGAYLGYGFHEDGTRSAVEVAKRLGGSLL
ncbi:MAG: FAD-dependent oxidoreductase [Bdellovibrionales bacterium]|nr:FAD-dependent oxidoreductase [Bdellovibrionales bacterium]